MSQARGIKSFYQDKNFNMQVIGGLMAVFMVGLSIYLTKHYFDVKFPTGLTGGGLCDINAFFNCDVATHSHLSNIAGVPISLLGLLLGAFILFGFLFSAESVEKTVHLLLWINGVGCFLLFVYSLVALGGLCPACTLYYICSWITLFIFFKTSNLVGFDIPIFGGYGVVFLIIFGATYSYVSGKTADLEKGKNKIKEGLISQFENLPDLGNPKFDSEFIMAKTEGSFKDAPVRITKFSDFECPACKMLSGILHNIAKKYEGKVAIQYFFYPLDNNCNPEMKGPLHRFACQAAYIAACKPADFARLEAEIFSSQASLTDEWIANKAKAEGVSDCVKKPETKEKVLKYINAAKAFNVKSTPTFLLNGVKIEGVLPQAQLEILIDYILEKK